MPTALIVEDEPQANELLSMLVRFRGYKTESAFTGGEALEMVERTHPDVVLLDLMLPDITGYEVCKSIKSHRETASIPVVMVTARVAADNLLKSVEVGASDYVSKPYTPDQIFKALSTADFWKNDILNSPPEGTVPLDARNEVETFEHVARLLGLILARTPWEERAVADFGLALFETARAAIDWGRRNQVGLVAALDYAVNPDRAVLTARDETGWLSPADPPRVRLADLVARGRFDEVVDGESGRSLVLTKRFA